MIYRGKVLPQLSLHSAHGLCLSFCFKFNGRIIYTSWPFGGFPVITISKGEKALNFPRCQVEGPLILSDFTCGIFPNGWWTMLYVLVLTKSGYQGLQSEFDGFFMSDIFSFVQLELAFFLLVPSMQTRVTIFTVYTSCVSFVLFFVFYLLGTSLIRQ